MMQGFSYLVCHMKICVIGAKDVDKKTRKCTER